MIYRYNRWTIARVALVHFALVGDGRLGMVIGRPRVARHPQTAAADHIGQRCRLPPKVYRGIQPRRKHVDGNMGRSACGAGARVMDPSRRSRRTDGGVEPVIHTRRAGRARLLETRRDYGVAAAFPIHTRARSVHTASERDIPILAHRRWKTAGGLTCPSLSGAGGSSRWRYPTDEHSNQRQRRFVLAMGRCPSKQRRPLR